MFSSGQLKQNEKDINLEAFHLLQILDLKIVHFCQ